MRVFHRHSGGSVWITGHRAGRPDAASLAAVSMVKYCTVCVCVRNRLINLHVSVHCARVTSPASVAVNMYFGGRDDSLGTQLRFSVFVGFVVIFF